VAIILVVGGVFPVANILVANLSAAGNNLKTIFTTCFSSDGTPLKQFFNCVFSYLEQKWRQNKTTI